jgi:membrane protease subunit (stomatin/prohibitin family)
MGFISKQFIDVIEWTEGEAGVLAFRFPMEDKEIQNGGKLTVRESQMAVFANEGIVADVFGPGLYTLNTHTLPLLTNLMNWDKLFQSPFKSDVYFFSTRLQLDQHWGTTSPIVFRDKEFGAIRLRGHGIYSYRITSPRPFHTKVSGTTPMFRVSELEGQLRDTIVGTAASTFAESSIPFLDMAANQVLLGKKVAERLTPMFSDLGLTLESFIVESLSLPEELQRHLDDRIGITMVGDLNNYTKFQVASSVPIAAANEGSGAAGLGAGLAIGMVMAKTVVDTIKGPNLTPENSVKNSSEGEGNKFCTDCGKPMPRRAKFCPECGQNQS